MITHASPLAVFEFASLPMLGWMAAAALPWLIHRWNWRQHQSTPWAAVELLLSAMQQRARRVQMQQWLLLAVRTTILVLMALAVAEPALRQWAVGADGKAQAHQIIVVDQSYSMGCEREDSSRWELALAHARQWIENSRGDALTVIGWSRQAENLLGRPTFDTSIALSALEDLQLSQSSADLPAALHAILAAIDRAEIEVPQIVNHQVVFCTDMGRQTWYVDDSLQELLDTISQRAHVTLANVAEGQSVNVTVTDLKIEPPLTIQQREATITATVSSFGNPPASDTTLELLVDGRRIGQKRVELRKQSETRARFNHRFVSDGIHTVRVLLTDTQDCLAIDNERWLIVDVQPKLQVACFAGQPAAADDLARALAPGSGLARKDEVIEPQVFSVGRLAGTDLSNYAAVLLASVEELSPREAALLTEYVWQGGGLAIFLGEAASSESFSELQPLRPVQVLGIQPTGEYRFDPREYRHPIVAPFRGQSQAGLLGVAVSQYHRLKLAEDRTSLEVVLSFNTGAPALVIDRFGLGRVAVSALPGSLVARTADGSPWSSFALSPSFLPVVRELVTYLVGDLWLQQRNLLVGEDAVFPWNSNAKAASVRLPSGDRRTLLQPSAEDRGQLVFCETDDRGVYRFDASNKELARLAVNLDTRESDLRPIDTTTLPAGLTSHQVEGQSEFSAVTGDISFVRSLLAGAAGLLLLEIGLAWMLGRGWG